MLIEAGLVGDRLAGVLGSAGELEGLRAVEGGGVPRLALLVRVNLFAEKMSVFWTFKRR